MNHFIDMKINAQEAVMNNNKKNQVTTILKGILFFTLLSVATGCAGGSGGPSASNDTTVSGNTAVPTAVPTAAQTNFKMDLCDEVNGWATDCRFLGMKSIKQNPEPIIPLAEEHGRGRGRGGREA